ncbi:MAG: hypothetical protein ACO1OB_09370 [Archangium sp.]
MHRIIVALALVAFVSCGEVCPDILHIPVLTFELPTAEATALEAGPSVVRTCVRDTCWSSDFTPPIAGFIQYESQTRRLLVEQRGQVDGGSTVIVRGAPMSDVALEVSRDGGVLFNRTWEDVMFDDGRIEGSSCGGRETSPVLTF